MAYVHGVEVGVGAFFDGPRFVGPVNLDWEHKRFFPGDLGELTGEMGTVVTYRGGDKLFAATLARVAPLLRSGHHVGYVNLNTIINAEGIWPLELTCRFGYPGFAILSALFRDDCAQICRDVARSTGRRSRPRTASPSASVLTVPPFPYHHGYEELGKGQLIHIPPTISAARAPAPASTSARSRSVDGQLVTAGQIGYAMVVTGHGATIPAARGAPLRAGPAGSRSRTCAAATTLAVDDHAVHRARRQRDEPQLVERERAAALPCCVRRHSRRRRRARGRPRR